MKPLFALIISALFTLSLVAKHHETHEDSYPLSVCIVSGEDLGSMGDPVSYWYKQDGKPDREVRFCCSNCEGRFEADPAKYLAKLDAATAGSAACCTEKTCCDGDVCADCANGTCEKPCCSDGTCAECAKSD